MWRSWIKRWFNRVLFRAVLAADVVIVYALTVFAASWAGWEQPASVGALAVATMAYQRAASRPRPGWLREPRS